MGFATGLLNFFKYLVMGVVTVSIVAGLTNDITHYSNSFMNDSEIKMVKHMDGDRFVASSEKEEMLKGPYYPVDQYGIHESRVNGMWVVYKYEKYGYVKISGKVSIMIKKLVGNGIVRVKQTVGHKELEIVKRRSHVNFKILSFPNDNDVVLGREYLDKDGNKTVLKLHARKVMRRMKIFKDLVAGKRKFVIKKQKIELPADNENYSDPIEMSLVIKNVYHPQKNSGVLEGEHVSGSVKIHKQTIKNSDGKIVSRKLTRLEELEVTIDYGGEQGSCDVEIGDVDLHDGNKFSVEIDSCDGGETVMSHGLVVESGKEVSVLISTGPFNGAALRFTTVENIAEYEKQRNAREDKAMLAEMQKEDAQVRQEEAADINEELNDSKQELAEGELPNDGSYSFENEDNSNYDGDDDYAQNSNEEEKGQDPDSEINPGYLEADTGKSPVISKKHMVTMVAM